MLGSKMSSYNTRRAPALLAAACTLVLWIVVRHQWGDSATTKWRSPPTNTQWWDSVTTVRPSDRVTTSTRVSIETKLVPTSAEVKKETDRPPPSISKADEIKDPCSDTGLSTERQAESKDTTVLVTGGAGFIGSNLVDRLLELGYWVKILDNLYTGYVRNVPLQDDRVEFYLGDILDEDDLKGVFSEVDYVYHMAAMSKVVPSLKDPGMARFCVESNVLGSWNVLNAAREYGKIKKVVYAASSTYYGQKPPPHQEDMAPDFITPYAASKYEGEIQMMMFDELFQVPTISTRFFMVYGPRQPSTGAYAIVTGVFAKQAASGKPLTIEGDGTHYRDFIHVSDIVEGMIIAQQSDLHGDVVNLGSGTSFSVQDVANLVSHDLVHVDARLHDLNGTLADTCKMKKLLGYKAKKEFEKEMSFMAKETMEGNVFMQPWLTSLHALSAPHILPLGSPMLKWPEDRTDLDALISFLRKIRSDGTKAEPADKQLVTIIPFDLTPESDIELTGDLLLNQIFSLVRFGQQHVYIAAAYTMTAVEACQFLNLPCFDATAVPELKVLDKLLAGGYDVHYSELGSSYTQNIPKMFIGQSSGDIFKASDSGKADIFIRNNDKTKAHVKKTLPTKTDDKTTPKYPHVLDHSTWKGLDVKTLDKKAWYCLTSEDSADDSTTNASVDKSTSIDVCSKQDLYAFSTCGNAEKGGPMTNKTVHDTIRALQTSGGWHLSVCKYRERCDRQQTIPLRWVAQPADLRVEGGFCGDNSTTRN